VAVDGRAGSGKTIFAVRLAGAVQAAGASVETVHTDDLASHDDFFGWTRRLVDGVLEPLRGGRAGEHAIYDWRARTAEERVVVQPCDVLLLDGVGAGRRELADMLAYTIWLEVNVRVAVARGLQRDIAEHGETMRAELTRFWTDRVRAEASFLAAQHTWQRADLLVDGHPSMVHDPQREFVRLV
jgi:uridine kinase